MRGQRLKTGLVDRLQFDASALANGWPVAWALVTVAALAIGFTILAAFVFVWDEPAWALAILSTGLLLTLAEGAYRKHAPVVEEREAEREKGVRQREIADGQVEGLREQVGQMNERFADLRQRYEQRDIVLSVLYSLRDAEQQATVHRSQNLDTAKGLEEYLAQYPVGAESILSAVDPVKAAEFRALLPDGLSGTALSAAVQTQMGYLHAWADKLIRPTYRDGN
jgi:hypothetical protein